MASVKDMLLDSGCDNDISDAILNVEGFADLDADAQRATWVRAAGYAATEHIANYWETDPAGRNFDPSQYAQWLADVTNLGEIS